MTPRGRALFLALVLAQAAHSIEELAFGLWERLPIARMASSLVSDDLALGFAVLNAFFVAFGLWCWIWPVRRGWPSARPIAWIWAAIEVGNGIGHPALAWRAGGYFPGVATAPILLILALMLVATLGRREERC